METIISVVMADPVSLRRVGVEGLAENGHLGVRMFGVAAAGSIVVAMATLA